MKCGKCGIEVPNSYMKCPSCGFGFHGLTTGSSFDSPAATGSPHPSGVGAAALPLIEGGLLAGFWKRAGAYLIDWLILVVPFVIIVFFVGFFSAFSGTVEALAIAQAQFAGLLVQAVYEGVFLSGPWAATPGKRLLGLRVLDTAGNKISFWRAVGRFFGKILSSIPLGLGFLMMIFTEKKQTLHDFMCSTIVSRDK